jgi:hypothetical protein
VVTRVSGNSSSSSEVAVLVAHLEGNNGSQTVLPMSRNSYEPILVPYRPVLGCNKVTYVCCTTCRLVYAVQYVEYRPTNYVQRTLVIIHVICRFSAKTRKDPYKCMLLFDVYFYVYASAHPYI